ncbi:ABC transporter permease [Rhodococcus sp. H29-C3]|uniref:ABC transporter permease n=1 Tax=Rhodococcus sp. H29-C3 TaxID=3046307 RepID=UPI0024BA4DD2|nr:ABC transporter permease [Rhodococcus sp. H29-C3]MDJ0362794.1 ABC transporter permease [Rhodococcus sp. H29-C3]
MITWALASFRCRITAALGVLLAVFIGVLITTATAQVMAAAGPQPPERLQGASLVVAGERATNVLGQAGDRSTWGGDQLAQLTQRILSVPGISDVVADRSFLAQIVTPAGALPSEDPQVAGHGWSSTSLAPYRLTSGAEPKQASEVVLGREFGSSVGNTVTLRTAQRDVEVTVAGTTDGPGLYFDDATAAQLAPAASLLGIEVTDQSGEASVQAMAAQFGGEVVTDRSALQDDSIAKSRYLSSQFLTALALASVVVSLFVVSVTSKFAVDERTQEFGLLRATGALPKQLRRVVLLEAALLGTVGSVAGAVAGVLATVPLAAMLRSWGILPAQLVLTIDWVGAMATVLGGIAIAVIGAAISAVSASRVSPLAAMRPESTRPRKASGRLRTISGTALAALVVIEVVAGRVVPGLDSVLMAIVIALTAAIAAACLAPVLVPRLARILLWLPWRIRPSAPLMVGSAEVTTNPRRSASIAAPAIIAAALAILTSGFIPTMRIAYPTEAASQIEGQSVVVSDGDYLTADQVSQAYEKYDVIEVGISSRARLVVPGSTVALPVTALPSAAEPSGFEVPRYLADENGWQTDDPVTLVMADGATLNPTITTIVDEPRGEHPGVALSEGIIRAHDPSAVADEVFVRSSSVQTSIEPPAGTRVTDAITWSGARYDKDLTLLNRYVMTFIAVAVGYAVLAATITIAMSMRHRQTQVRTLARSGATKRQISGVVVIEAVVAGACGVLLGALCTLVPLHEMAAGLSNTTGSPVGVHLDWAQALLVPLGIACMMGATASVVSFRSGPASIQ